MTRLTLTIAVLLAITWMAYGLAVIDFGQFLVVAWIAVPLIATAIIARIVRIKNRIRAAVTNVFVYFSLFAILFFCLSQGKLAGAFAKALHISS